MTGDALDRAAQALREEFLRPVSKTWEHASADTQRLWRDSAAAAVRVMADDLRACHKPSYRDEEARRREAATDA